MSDTRAWKLGLSRIDELLATARELLQQGDREAARRVVAQLDEMLSELSQHPDASNPLQQRMLRNRSEDLAALKLEIDVPPKQASRGRKSTPVESGDLFSEHDFHNAMTGTTWRRRIAETLKNRLGPPFGVKSVYHMREVQIGHLQRMGKPGVFAKISVFLGHEEGHTWDIADPGELVVAFWMEKGLEKLGKDDKPASLMTPEWDWHRFVGNVLVAQNGEKLLRSTLEAAHGSIPVKGTDDSKWVVYEVRDGAVVEGSDPGTRLPDVRLVDVIGKRAQREDKWLSVLLKATFGGRERILGHDLEAIDFIQHTVNAFVPLYNVCVSSQFQLPRAE